jgi:hypothetical protein
VRGWGASGGGRAAAGASKPCQVGGATPAPATIHHHGRPLRTPCHTSQPPAISAREAGGRVGAAAACGPRTPPREALLGSGPCATRGRAARPRPPATAANTKRPSVAATLAGVHAMAPLARTAAVTAAAAPAAGAAGAAAAAPAAPAACGPAASASAPGGGGGGGGGLPGAGGTAMCGAGARGAGRAGRRGGAAAPRGPLGRGVFADTATRFASTKPRRLMLQERPGSTNPRFSHGLAFPGHACGGHQP